LEFNPIQIPLFAFSVGLYSVGITLQFPVNINGYAEVKSQNGFAKFGIKYTK
jgi:hypothetical protein